MVLGIVLAGKHCLVKAKPFTKPSHPIALYCRTSSSREQWRMALGGVNYNMKILVTKFQTKTRLPFLQIYYFNLILLLEKLHEYSKPSAEFSASQSGRSISGSFTRPDLARDRGGIRRSQDLPNIQALLLKFWHELCGLKELTHLHKLAFSW